MLTLYRAPFSTNVERVALALAHKGLEVESVEISYADRSPVLEVSGQPLVPVLVDGDAVVADSIRILRHLEQRQPEPALFPREPAARARMDVFIDWFDEVWKAAPNRIEDELEAERPEAELIARCGAQMRARLDLFEAMLDGNEHLFGELSAADFVAFPFLRYAAGRDPLDDELFHRVLQEHQRLDGGHPRLAAWIERVGGLPTR